MKRYLIDLAIMTLIFGALCYTMVSWERSESAWQQDYKELSSDYDILANEYIELKGEYFKLLDKEDRNDNTIQKRKTEL